MDKFSSAATPDPSGEPGRDGLAPLRPATPVLSTAVHVGEALRQVREGLGLGVDDISQATRVRPAYLSAIEALDQSRLPPRVFALGYVRSYAQALGLDANAVAERFKAEVPEAVVTLPQPPERRRETRPGWILLGVAALLIGGGVLVWNILVHDRTRPGPTTHVVAAPSRPVPPPPPGPAHLGAPLPAPETVSAPEVYETPGLAKAIARGQIPASVILGHPVAPPPPAAAPVAAPGQSVVQTQPPTAIVKPAAAPEPVRPPPKAKVLAQNPPLAHASPAPSTSVTPTPSASAPAAQAATDTSEPGPAVSNRGAEAAPSSAAASPPAEKPDLTAKDPPTGA